MSRFFDPLQLFPERVIRINEPDSQNRRGTTEVGPLRAGKFHAVRPLGRPSTHPPTRQIATTRRDTT